MKRFKNAAIVAGSKFGRWTVLGENRLFANSAQGRRYGWICRCECGTERIVAESDLVIRRGSCGCMHSEQLVARNHAKMQNPYICRVHGEIDKPYLLTKSNGAKQRACPICRAKLVRKSRLDLRMAIIAGYGGRCACCGESNPGFLTIDHIHGNGSELRRTTETGVLYWKLSREGFPKDNHRLYCMNCNWGSYRNGNQCPHTKERGLHAAAGLMLSL
jgi:hypothetical protein